MPASLHSVGVANLHHAVDVSLVPPPLVKAGLHPSSLVFARGPNLRRALGHHSLLHLADHARLCAMYLYLSRGSHQRQVWDLTLNFMTAQPRNHAIALVFRASAMRALNHCGHSTCNPLTLWTAFRARPIGMFYQYLYICIYHFQIIEFSKY